MKTPEEIIYDRVGSSNPTDIISIQEAIMCIQDDRKQYEGKFIQAKALRKKGTDKFYYFKVKEILSQFTYGGDWILKNLPDINNVLWSSIPEDAEPVNIKIIIES